MAEPTIVDTVLDFMPAIVTIMMVVMVVGLIGKIKI